MRNTVVKWLPLISIIIVVLLIDQLSKQWVIDNLAVNQTMSLPIVSPFIQFTRTVNTGIAFGIGAGGSLIFLVLSSLIVIALLIYFARTTSPNWLLKIGLALVIGGALGNVVDRIQHGHVVDFFHIVIPSLISNVSNFADHAIVIGVGGLLLESYLAERRQKESAAETIASEV